MKKRALLLACALLAGLAAAAMAETRDYLRKPADWFAGAEGRRITANLLSWQSDAGSWPKNMDPTAKPYAGADRAKDLKGTFDNGATVDELRFLARAWVATSNAAARAAVERGVEAILAAQYPTGGWPQYYPPPAKSYHRHITFNDGSMVRVMELLRDVQHESAFAFLGDARRAAAGAAFERGIACILRCQIRDGGALTAWCVQHDEVTLEPRPARAYELVSISGSESVGIVRLLMSLEHPSPEVVRAVDAAAAWFERVKLEGQRVDTVDGDRVVVRDPAARPMWARFYELGTGRPIFCDRDGVAKYALADIGRERRNGYAWLGYWPESLLAKDYPAWRARVAAGP